MLHRVAVLHRATALHRVQVLHRAAVLHRATVLHRVVVLNRGNSPSQSSSPAEGVSQPQPWLQFDLQKIPPQNYQRRGRSGWVLFKIPPPLMKLPGDDLWQASPDSQPTKQVLPRVWSGGSALTLLCDFMSQTVHHCPWTLLD